MTEFANKRDMRETRGEEMLNVASNVRSKNGSNVPHSAWSTRLPEVSASKKSHGEEGSTGHTELFHQVSKFRDFRRAGIAKFEQQYLQDLMSISKGDIKEALQISGLSRSRLYGLLRKHKISRPD